MSEFSQFVELVQSVYSSRDFIALHEPRFLGDERKFVNEAIDSTFVSSVGKFVDQFEIELAKYTSTKRAAATVNGTSALQVALRIAGVRTGDEVITQALTFVATANSISYNSAQPVFIDVDSDTMGMSPLALTNFLDEYGDLREDGTYNKLSGRRIGAILPMHTFGFMCRIEEIVKISMDWKIPVVEDAAESLGSFYREGAAGSFGMMGAFSFNGNKLITAGGGGAIVSREEAPAAKAKYLTNTAKVPHAWDYYHDEIGYNFRMPNINAALALGQLRQIEKFIESKKEVFQLYRKSIEHFSFNLKDIPLDTKWNYWLICLELSDEEERNEFLKSTNELGVMTRPIWKLMFDLPMYESCQRDEQKNAIVLSKTIVNIPSSVR